MQTPILKTRGWKAVLKAAGILALATGALPAHAQTSQGDYVVTATRTVTPSGRLGSSVTVIGREEIERRQVRSMVELLRSIRGLHVTQSGGRGKQASIFSRGTNSNHTLFLINGIRVSDPSTPSGTFQLEHLNLEDIERIEVVRGPQSVLYGSEAIGAVINIITRKGGKGIVATGTAEGGSFSTVEAKMVLDGTYQWLDFNFGYSRFDSKGISILPKRLNGFEKDGTWNSNFSGRLGVRAAKWLDLDFYGKLVRSKSEIDPFVDDLNAISKTRQNFGRGSAKFKLFEARLISTISFSYTGHDRTSINPPDPNNPATNTISSFLSDKKRIGFQSDFKVLAENTVTLGGNIEWERAKSGGSAFFAFSKTQVNKAIFMQDQFAISDRLFGTVGLRVDQVGSFRTAVTWRVAPAYVIKETGTTIKGSYGTGFKAPTLQQRFGFNPGFPGFGFPAFNGNPALKPETSRGWDFGFEQKLFKDKLTFGVTYFRNDIRNLIVANAAFTTNINVGRARTHGIETFVKAEILKNLDLNLNYTYLRAEDRVTGAELVRRPRHSFNAELAWKPVKKASISLAVHVIGRRTDFQAIAPFGRVKLPHETTVKVAGSYKINKYLTVFARLENLFDSKFEEPNGFQNPGFAVFGGIKVSLNLLNP
ncbi:MAG: TonB-dependent receptor plug domain-containing protein [Alphaproteobacteria bacterium]